MVVAEAPRPGVVSLEHESSVVLPPSPEILRSGDLAIFLEEEYLLEFFEGKPSHFREIPGIINELLTPVLSPAFTERAEITSGVARCMATGLPPRFWQYPQYFEEQLFSYRADPGWVEERQTAAGEAVEETLKYLVQGPADLDLKALPKLPYQSLGEILEKSLEMNPEEIAAVPIGEVVRKRYEFSEEEFLIRIDYGPIPTNPDREGVAIDFLEQGSERKVFTIHLGRWPQEAEDARQDRRLGDTCDKQDFCTVPVQVEDGRLTYQVPREATEVMQEADRITEVFQDLGGLMEITLRALRINLLHPLEDRVNFDRFFPLLADESLWKLRAAIRDFALQGGKIPDHVRPIVVREFLLSLTSDPYQTGQFLRDTGFSLLIPGLADLSWTDWQDILSSDVLALTLDETGRRLPHERGADYLAEQREVYREEKFFGVEKFLEALSKVKGLPNDHSPWFSLLDLFEEKILRGEALEGSYQPTTGFASQVFEAVRGEIVISVPVEFLGDTSVQALLLRELLASLEKEPEVDELIEMLGGIRIEETHRGRHKIDPDVIRSMVRVIHRLPAGLTPRELSDLVPTPDFGWQLLFLKLNGLIERSPLKRIDRRGEEVEVEFYSLRRNPPTVDLFDICQERGFVRRFQETSWRGEARRRFPLRYMNALKRGGLPTNLEVLQTLTPLDFNMLWVNDFPKGEEACQLVQQLAEVYWEYSK